MGTCSFTITYNSDWTVETAFDWIDMKHVSDEEFQGGLISGYLSLQLLEEVS